MEAIPCDEVCRLCISQQKSIDLFSTPNDIPKYSEIVKILTIIDISENDGYPNGICDECALKLIQYYKFKIQIEKSHTELTTFLKTQDQELLEEQDDEFSYEIINYPPENEHEENELVIETEVASAATNKSDSEIIEWNLNIKQDEVLSNYQEVLELKNEENSQESAHRKPLIIQEDLEYLEDLDIGDIDENSIEVEVSNDLFLGQRGEIMIDHRDEEDVIIDSVRRKDEFVEPNFKPGTEQLPPDQQREWQNKVNVWIKKQAKQEKLNKRYVCNVCGKEYRSKSALSSHGYVHTGQMNFECLECGRKFGQKRLLAAHMEVKHIKSKFWFCDVCGRQFNRRNNMLHHKWVHVPDDKGPFSCQECGKTFKWRTSYKVHLASHSGEKYHVCNICRKSYTSDSSLRKHCKRNHDGLGMKPLSEQIEILEGKE